MKAIYLEGIHQPIQYTDRPKSETGAGQVLVKLQAASLNHRDVYVQQGLYPGIKLPVILGSDGSGIVEAVGEGVDTSWLGKSVVINPALHWGDNPAFYGADFRILGMPENGTFADYIAVDANYVHPKPEYLSFEQAAAFPLAGLTAWRALMSRAGLKTDNATLPEKVLITGIGGGAALFALQFAVASGAEVWVTSGSDEKLAKAKELGATGGINYRETDWHKTLMAQTGGGRSGYFNVIIDSAGGPSFARLIDVAAPGGRIAFFGGTTGNITDIVPAKVFFKQLSIFGSTMGNEREFAEMLAFVELKKLVPIIDSILPLAEAEQAMLKMESGSQLGKIVLKISS
ncbi:zinc-binding dehydrogenase [Spirosoma daeguense]